MNFKKAHIIIIGIFFFIILIGVAFFLLKDKKKKMVQSEPSTDAYRKQNALQKKNILFPDKNQNQANKIIIENTNNLTLEEKKILQSNNYMPRTQPAVPKVPAATIPAGGIPSHISETMRVIQDVQKINQSNQMNGKK